jgi:hypothetical protein
MSPECLPLLEDVGLREETLALGARRVAGMHIHGYGHAARGRYGPVGRARARFDHGYAVRREAQGEVGAGRPGSRDQDVARGGDHGLRR